MRLSNSDELAELVFAMAKNPLPVTNSGTFSVTGSDRTRDSSSAWYEVVPGHSGAMADTGRGKS